MLLSIPCSLAEFQEPNSQILREALEFACGWGPMTTAVVEGQLSLEVDFDHWSRLGEYPSGIVDPDLKDEAVEVIENLEQLFSPGTPAVEVRLKGILGGTKSTIELRTERGLIQLTGPWPTLNEAPVSIGPLMAAAFRAVRDYNQASDQQLRMSEVLRLNRLERAHARAVNRQPLLKLAKALHVEATSRSKKLSIRVVDAARRDAVSVVAEVVDEQGEIIEISSKTHRHRSSIVDAPGNRKVELSESHRRALSDIVALKAVPKDKALSDPRFESPQRFLSTEALEEAGNTIEFFGYSERVIAFRPAGPGEMLANRNDWAIRWYDADDGSDNPVFHVIRVPLPSGEVKTIGIPSREEAEEVSRRLQQFIASSRAGVPQQPVEINGLTIEEPEVVQADLAKTLLGISEGNDKRQGDQPGDSNAAGRPTLVAELRDAAANQLSPARGFIEPPWIELEALLSPGIHPLEHQQTGIRWLWTRYQESSRSNGTGVLLADDMGLGKTFQVAALLALVTARARSGMGVRPHLVVAPKILLTNWQREVQRYFRAQVLSCGIVEARDLKPGIGLLVDRAGQIVPRALADRDLWVLSYDTVQAYGEALARVDWGIVVLDEAQTIKNAATAASRNCRALKKQFGVLSTGTPVENRLTDLFALGDFAFPGVLAKNVGEFVSRYEVSNGSGTFHVQRRLQMGDGPQALVMRREKKIVLHDSLPPKLHQRVLLPMTSDQRDIESQLIGRARSSRKGSLEVLSSLQKLYQHPRLLLPDDDLVANVDGLIDSSPKLSWLTRYLEDRTAEDSKVLVFALYRRMQQILVRVLERRFGIRHDVVINGDPGSLKTAHKRIDEFSARDGFDVLVLSPRAAGTGLNITAANHVVHYGRWWNPAREDQATDRAYRIGQMRAVHVWVPILHHPDDINAGFDVAVDTLLERKRSLADDFLSGAASEMEADVADLIRGS